MNKFLFDAFLSHNSSDKAFVRKIAKILKTAGLEVWFDEWVISPGDDIYLKIEEGLEVSKVLVLFMSVNAFLSDWVKLERSAAIFRDPANKTRRFVPVLIGNCEIPDTLKRLAYIDLREFNPTGIQMLCNTLKKEIQDINGILKFNDLDAIFYHSQYPYIEFSIINRSVFSVQITSINAVKWATEKHERSMYRYNTGPRIALELNLNKISNGRGWRIFGEHDVSNLRSGESEAFKMVIRDCSNSLSILGIEICYISEKSPNIQNVYATHMLLIESPTEKYDNDGSVYILNKQEALSYLLQGPGNSDHKLCQLDKDLSGNLRFVLARSAACLAKNNDLPHWSILLKQYENTEYWGSVLASWAEFGLSDVPPQIEDYFLSWVKDPVKITRVPIWDNEAHSIIVLTGILKKYGSLNLIGEIIDATAGFRFDVNIDTNNIEKFLKMSSFTSLSVFRDKAMGFVIKVLGKEALGLLILVATTNRIDAIEARKLIGNLMNNKDIPQYNSIEFEKYIIDLWFTSTENKSNELLARYFPRTYRAFDAKIKKYGLDELVTCGDQFLLENLAANKNLSSKNIAALISDGDKDVRINIAQRPDLSFFDQEKLSRDHDVVVRRHLARNKNLDEKIRDLLNEDKDDIVRENISKL